MFRINSTQYFSLSTPAILLPANRIIVLFMSSRKTNNTVLRTMVELVAILLEGAVARGIINGDVSHIIFVRYH